MLRYPAGRDVMIFKEILLCWVSGLGSNIHVISVLQGAASVTATRRRCLDSRCAGGNNTIKYFYSSNIFLAWLGRCTQYTHSSPHTFGYFTKHDIDWWWQSITQLQYCITFRVGKREKVSLRDIYLQSRRLFNKASLTKTTSLNRLSVRKMFDYVVFGGHERWTVNTSDK